MKDRRGVCWMAARFGWRASMQFYEVKRLDFITLLGSAAIACTGQGSYRMISRFIRREPWMMTILT
jgi:hypothetical protein